MVESCSGRRAPFDAVTWFTVPAGQLLIRGGTAAGAWFVEQNRIAIAGGWKYEGSLVRHEMLHAILGTGSHPEDFFLGKCGYEVACGRDCQAPVALPYAIQVSVDVLEADAVMYPQVLSLSAHDGRGTVVIGVRNPTNANVFVPAERFGETRCGVGFLIASVSAPDWSKIGCGYLDYSATDSRVYFRPGERRRLLFEVDLRVPTFGGPLHPGALTLSAILGDNLRKTTAATLLP